jgi:DNA-nicking Smr family endonuclease
VHSLLRRHPQVLTFRLAHPGRGGWGATTVVLKYESAGKTLIDEEP